MKENLSRYSSSSTFLALKFVCPHGKCGSTVVTVHTFILIFQINIYIQQVPILEGEESDGDVPRLGKSSTLIISLTPYSLCKQSSIDFDPAFAAFYKKSPNQPFKPSSHMVAENLSENLRWRTFDRKPPSKCCSKTQENQKQFSQVTLKM